MRALLEVAKSYLALNLSVLPADLNGKRPVVPWTEFQGRQPTLKEIDEWWARHHPTAVCIVGGAVSGNLEMIDFDLMAEWFPAWREIVLAEAPELFAKLVVERSQSGGKHIVYRCEEAVERNQTLAQKEITVPDGSLYSICGKGLKPYPQGDQWRVLLTYIETRGEAGIFLCDPSPGYELEQGSFDAIPRISAKERAILIEAARSLNEYIEVAEPFPILPKDHDGNRPGDDFNRRGDLRPTLLKHGWRPAGRSKGELWRRPGKEFGSSASLKDNTLFVYTNSIPQLKDWKAYSAFHVYAILEHQGDHSAAARALAAEGFGAAPSWPARDSASPLNSHPMTPGSAPTRSNQGRWILHPAQTIPTANAYIEEYHSHPDGPTLHHFADATLEWRDGSYHVVEEGALAKRMQNWLHGCLKHGKDGDLQPFNSNPTTVKAAITTLKGQVYLPATTPLPSWLGDAPPDIDPRDVIACKSNLLHLPTNTTLPATPSFFTTSALDFDHDPAAPFPERWGQFLHEVFDGDCEQWDLLQEWFGYCLTGDTSLQKMLLMVGPKRSGKGTMARVLSRLVGLLNVCGPTVSSLAGPFGLQPLVGKTLAVVSDARFHGENIMTVVERLLCISGEDLITVDRKHMASLHMRLRTRFLFLTNEFPRFTDASAALAGRFMVLQLRRSFYEQEYPHLTERLCEELPGILNWAIEGWHRLRERGRFHMPQASRDAVNEIEELSSPVSAFVRDCCMIGASYREDVSRLYAAWLTWCEGEGRDHPGTRPGFCRDLSAAHPTLHRRRGTGNVPFYEGITLKALA